MLSGYEPRSEIMEFHQLRYFVAAAEESGITRAAEKLHVSQPALSRQIAALEDELGVKLFQRSRQRIQLTPAGEYFLPKVRDILESLQSAASDVGNRFGTISETVRIGFLLPFLDDVITPALRALKISSPMIEIVLAELAPQEQLDRLRDGRLDMAVIGNLNADAQCRFISHRLMRSRMAVVVPDDHTAAGRASVGVALNDFARDAFVSLSDKSFPGRRDTFEKICRQEGFSPNIVSECDSVNLMLGQVSIGAGVALVPEHCRKLPHAGCSFLRLEKPVLHSEVLAVVADPAAESRLAPILNELSAAAKSAVLPDEL